MKHAIRNALLLSPPQALAGNGPAPDATGQQRQYMDDPARRMMEKMAPYSTDFFGAEVQGLDPEDFWKTDWYEIRAADVFPSASISETSRHSDWKTIAFRRRDVDYIPTGAKVWFWKSCWLAYNPDNIGGAYAPAVIRRCNQNWKRYDYYGNILIEPFVVERPSTRSNANEYNAYQGLPDHYSNCVMQANPETLSLKENDRMVMGSAVYAVRGLSDYILDFSTEADSVKLLYFSLYFQQPTERDDMEQGIAGGKAFSWEISVDGPREVLPGRAVQFTASSIRCGEVPDREVDYLWESLSPILEVDGEGHVIAAAEGTGEIRCRLKQNPDIYTDTLITVAGSGLAWASDVPDSLPIYRCVTLSVQSEKEVEWTFSGPPDSLYQSEVNGMSTVLTGYYPSAIPLTVTVTDGERTLTAKIKITAR